MRTEFVASFEAIDRKYKEIRDEVHYKGLAGSNEHSVTCKLLMERYGNMVDECIACLGCSPVEEARKRTLKRWRALGQETAGAEKATG